MPVTAATFTAALLLAPMSLPDPPTPNHPVMFRPGDAVPDWLFHQQPRGDLADSVKGLEADNYDVPALGRGDDLRG